MGRELKRVSLDFVWPINKIWSGYINPHDRHECHECDGLGWSKDYNDLKELWYGYHKQDWKPNPHREGARYNSSSWNNNVTEGDVQALIEADRLWDFTRVPLNDEQVEIVKNKMADGGNSWLPFNNGYIPTPSEVNEWNLKGMGHDSLNCSIIIKANLKKQGKSHLCKHCDGKGVNWQTKRAKKDYKKWKNYDPPAGEGYQLWGTTSEGQPMTPVFKSLEELCEYCENKNVSHFGSYTATKEEWFKMLSDGDTTYKTGNMLFN